MAGKAALRRIVAIGGGTGLPVLLTSLKDWTEDLTAVVTMADDGGSSGRLRHELNVLPPGDIRNCLVALADEDNELASLFQYRFSDGSGLAKHNLGNLIITALADGNKGLTGAIDTISGILEIKGKVVPSTLDDITLWATTKAQSRIKGQAIIARSGPLDCVYIEPGDARAYQPAIEAIENADALILGPGSLFTSIIPMLLVRDISDAIRRSAAAKIYVCNTVNQRKETLGFTTADYLESLEKHAGGDFVDVMVVNDQETSMDGLRRQEKDLEFVEEDPSRTVHVDVIKADLMDPDNPLRHHPQRLKQVLYDILSRAGAYG
ncbi:MAG: YvcK family protein [Bacteroidetes bacterium]|nr:YvcK family protein [Bacteroidota bacterium]